MALKNLLVHTFADHADWFDKVRFPVRRQRSAHGDRDVSVVNHVVVELPKPTSQSGIAYSTRPYVNSAQVLPQVHRNTNQPYRSLHSFTYMYG